MDLMSLIAYKNYAASHSPANTQLVGFALTQRLGSSIIAGLLAPARPQIGIFTPGHADSLLTPSLFAALPTANVRALAAGGFPGGLNNMAAVLAALNAMRGPLLALCLRWQQSRVIRVKCASMNVLCLL